MSGKVTYYGYFGRPTNVHDCAIDADAFAALIGALPSRRPAMLDPQGRPLRFIALDELPASQPASQPAESSQLPQSAARRMSAANDRGDSHGG